MINLEELNSSQRDAVLCIDAPSLVIAGAGSGKTRVLTYKIAYLLEQGMQPWNILALTFTNKAAREMRQRIGTLVSPEKASSLWMGTFHSIFARILRTEGQRLGYDVNYTIYDTADGLALIRQIVREMGLDDKVYKPTALQNRISSAKNSLILPSAYAGIREFRESDEVTRRVLTPEIYNRYQQYCRQANAMDFDDLLLNMWLILEQNPDVAAHWQDRFHFVLVDEYQDTNYAQHQIIRRLTDRRQRVCVVGDDAQSIYSFRGANIDNILHFREAYPGTRLFKLEQNYRSTQTIVGAAGSLIRNNRQQIAKNVFSEKEQGSPIMLLRAYSDTEEAGIVLREVQRLHRSGTPYRDIAILYRTNAQSRKIEDSLLYGHVPYHIYAGMSFYQREEIKDMLCYLRLAVNLHDEESLLRIINKPARGIGDVSVKKLVAEARERQTTLWDVLEATEAPRLAAFRDMIIGFHQHAQTDDAHTLALNVFRASGLEQVILAGHDPDDIARQENVQELLDGIAAFVSESREQGLGVLVGDFLQEASLATDFERSGQGTDDDCVSMMTIHSAKGLEFPVVFIVGLEEGLFPGEMASESPRAIEEERRLFYVALTRAERQVVLTYAMSRFRYGKTEGSSPSRFIREIPREYYSSGHMNRDAETNERLSPRFEQGVRPLLSPSPRPSVRPAAGGIPPARPLARSVARTEQGSPSSPATGSLAVGTAVLHERFGRGVVEAVEGSGIDAKAVVRFENVGTKVLMLRFAKLTVL